jgi:hypothetical protein
MSGRFRWALDAGALHLYDLDPAVDDAEAIVTEADRIARAEGAAVSVATLVEPDPWIEALCRHGFEVDSTEPTVKDGQVRNEVILVRIVG